MTDLQIAEIHQLLRFTQIDSETAQASIDRRDPDMLLTVASRVGGIIWAAEQLRKLLPPEVQDLTYR